MGSGHEILRHPSSKVFVTAFVNKRFTQDLDVVPCLGNVNTIEHIKVALAFDRNTQPFIQHVK
jgi:hypothetical protein